MRADGERQSGGPTDGTGTDNYFCHTELCAASPARLEIARLSVEGETEIWVVSSPDHGVKVKGGTGFLYGLGTGHISDLEALNGDVGEIVRDFTEISRASGDDADADESNEQAYAELVEFIRVAAQVVFEELLPLRSQVYPAQQRLH